MIYVLNLIMTAIAWVGTFFSVFCMTPLGWVVGIIVSLLVNVTASTGFFYIFWYIGLGVLGSLLTGAVGFIICGFVAVVGTYFAVDGN